MPVAFFVGFRQSTARNSEVLLVASNQEDSITSSGSMEEALDQGWQSLHPTQVRHGHGSQGFSRCDPLASQRLVLRVVPHQFVQVEFRRVRRQVMQLKHPFVFLHKTPHRLGSMDRVVVHNQENGRGRIHHQASEKPDEHRCRHSSRSHHEAKLPTGTDGRDEVRPEPRTRARHHRSMPRRPQVVLQ